MDYYEDDDDKRPDYFEDDADTEEPVKTKKIKYSPEDPRYWTESSGRWDHITPSRPPRKAFVWAGIGVAALLFIALISTLYLSPCITGASQSGYVASIQCKRGMVTSFEGVLLPYRDLMDTTKIYQRDFIFSVQDAKVAAELKRMMIAGKPVRVEYIQYRVRLPWKGESTVIVTSADSVDPSRLLPPDRQPKARYN